MGERPRGYLISVAVIAALGGLLFGYDTAVISGAVEPLRRHFSLSALALGWVVGCALIGCVIGAAIAGKLADLIGRRAVIWASALMFTTSGLWCYAASSVTSLVYARILGGIAVGLASLLVPVYIAELAPPRHRGALVSLNQVAILVGMVLSYLANAVIIRTGSAAWMTHQGWRIMLGSEAIPATFFLLLSFALPESPRWLVQNERSAKALEILNRLHGPHVAKWEIAEISRTIAAESGSVLELLRPGARNVVVKMMVLALFQAITGINIIMYYSPTIFASAGFGARTSLDQSAIIGLVMLLFTLVSMLLVDRLGRRPILLGASFGMGASLAFLDIIFPLGQTAGGWLLMGVLTYVASFSIGMGGIYWVVVSEIFPTRVRGTAMSLSVIFLWGGNFLVSQLFPELLEMFGAHVFAMFAISCGACLLFIWFFIPETKGKTLEQIEADLFGVKP